MPSRKVSGVPGKRTLPPDYVHPPPHHLMMGFQPHAHGMYGPVNLGQMAPGGSFAPSSYQPSTAPSTGRGEGSALACKCSFE